MPTTRHTVGAGSPPHNVEPGYSVQWSANGRRVEAIGHLSDGWDAHFDIAFLERRPVVRSVTIKAGPHRSTNGGLTGIVLKEVSVTAAVAAVEASFGRNRDLDRGEGLRRAARGQGRRGPVALPDAHFVKIAEEYVAESKLTPRPYRSLAKRLGYGEATVKKKIVEARKRGLLTGTQRGAAGGELTAKAKRLLAEKA